MALAHVWGVFQRVLIEEMNTKGKATSALLGAERKNRHRETRERERERREGGREASKCQGIPSADRGNLVLNLVGMDF